MFVAWGHCKGNFWWVRQALQFLDGVTAVVPCHVTCFIFPFVKNKYFINICNAQNYGNSTFEKIKNRKQDFV